jgi:hypothetical protein
MRIRMQIAVCAVLALFSAPAAAVGSLADVTIHDGTQGRALPVYRHDGRYYVVGRPGNEYRIRVRNRTREEILAVVSVDGVNAVSGETAAWDQAGYVLLPNQRYDIAGWRKSLQRVAAFFFTQHENSYAARTGRPDNVGVIGVAVFRKKAPPEARLPAPHRHRELPADSPFPSAADEVAGAAGRSERAAESDAAARFAPAPQAEKKLGTGHGRDQSAPVTYTSFERASPAPQEVIAIHYDTYQNLVALGVIRAPRVATPTPFPGQFVPDPR